MQTLVTAKHFQISRDSHTADTVVCSSCPRFLFFPLPPPLHPSLRLLLVLLNPCSFFPLCILILSFFFFLVFIARFFLSVSLLLFFLLLACSVCPYSVSYKSLWLLSSSSPSLHPILLLFYPSFTPLLQSDVTSEATIILLSINISLCQTEEESLFF